MITHLRASLFVLLGLSLAPAGASVQAVSDVLKQWGVLGTWAVDCRAAPSEQNPHVTIAARRDRTAYHERSFGKDRDTNEIKQASITQGGVLVLVIAFPRLKQVRENAFVKAADGRKRAFSNRQVGGNYTVRDGKYVGNGKETPWQTRCN